MRDARTVARRPTQLRCDGPFVSRREGRARHRTGVLPLPEPEFGAVPDGSACRRGLPPIHSAGCRMSFTTRAAGFFPASTTEPHALCHQAGRGGEVALGGCDSELPPSDSTWPCASMTR